MSAKVKATGGATIEKWGFNDIVKVSEPLARFVGRSEISFVAALRKLLEYTKDHDLLDEGVTLLEFPWVSILLSLRSSLHVYALWDWIL